MATPIRHSALPCSCALAALLLLTACGGDGPADRPGREPAAVGAEEPSDRSAESGSAPGGVARTREGEAAGHREGAEEHEGRGEHAAGGEHGARAEGEHREGGEHAGAGETEGAEESGVYVGRADTWDAARRGARLVLSFREAEGAFVGRVENTTTGPLCRVRVEVHLEGGTELGPTDPVTLEAGGSVEVRLPWNGTDFRRWTAHPEVSACGA